MSVRSSGLQFQLILFTILSVTFSLLLVGVGLDYLHNEIHNQNARKLTEKAFGVLHHRITNIERRLFETTDPISRSESIVSSVNLINEYQDTSNYNAIIFDEEKKRLAHELLKQIKTSEISELSVYDKSGYLLAFALWNDNAYTYGIGSYDNGQVFYLIAEEGSDVEGRLWRRKQLPDRIYPTIPAINTRDSFILRAGKSEYKSIRDQLFISFQRVVLRRYPDGKHLPIGFVEAGFSFSKEVLEDVSKQAQVVFSMFLGNGRRLNAPNDLGQLENLSHRVHLFGKNKGEEINWLPHDHYFLHGHVLPALGGSVYFISVLPKAELFAAIKDTRKILLGIFLVTALLSISAGILWLRYSISKPLTKLTRDAIKIENGEYEKFPVIRKHNEIGILSRVLLRVVEAVQSREKALRKSEDRLTKAQEIATLGNWEYHYQKRQWWMSDYMAGLLEVDADEEIDLSTFTRSIDTEDRERVSHLFQKALHEHIPFHAKYRLDTSSGSVITVRTIVEFTFDINGKPSIMMGTTQDISELQLAYDRLDHLAHHDSLTNLANRILFNDRLQHAIDRHERKNKQLAVMFLDLDHFKDINDIKGHIFGDSVLLKVAERLKQVVRSGDTIARLGGDEFILLLEDLPDRVNCEFVAEKILNSMNEPIEVDDEQVQIGVSIGIVIFPDDGNTVVDLVKNADTAMYQAKSQGRNSYHYYSEHLSEMLLARLKLLEMLRQAITDEAFRLVYQPQFDLKTGKLVGAEALIRWTHPLQGNVPPDQFVPLAEQSGLIKPIDLWVLSTAIEQVEQWDRDGFILPQISINVSGASLQQKKFLESMVELIKDSKLEPERIELEVTESYLMEHRESVQSVLHRLRGEGIHLAIDDFGTGYSSLAYLKDLPLTKLKIDRSFIQGIPDNAKNVAITKSVIVLAQSLNLDVLAEGVELEEQASLLRKEGCNMIQGYLKGRPVEAEEFFRRSSKRESV